MTDCLFCRIVSGEISATVVRETETTVAFRDLDPQAPTHVLVIPRAHHATAGALAHDDPALMARVMADGHDVASQEGIADSGYRMVINTGPDAQQSVFHVHLHVLGGRTLSWPPG